MSHFEIFILNYNGSRFLNDCLSSLERLELGQHRVGVNVIDNGSSDDSKALVGLFADVNFIELGRNLGFSSGNNKGVEIRLAQLQTEPDYLMFLNNDTTVDSQMVKSIAATFSRNVSAGVVGVKSLFKDDFIPVSFNIDCDFVDVTLQGENFGQDYNRYRIFRGCHLGGSVWRVNRDGCLFIPVENPSKKSKIRLAAYKSADSKLTLLRKFYRQDNLFNREQYNSFSINQEIEVAPSAYVKLIQNAGSFVTQAFEAGDMGSYEIDSGQYSEDRELNAVCGVAMAIKTNLFRSLNGFDPHFFAYYEDTDLSLRARRKGSKCFYCASALIHHVHAGSSGVVTNYFRFNVTYSRLYFLSKFAPRALFKKRLSEIRALSTNEFEHFMLDGFSENKPNLRSYAKYFKYRLKFLINRFLRLLNLRTDKLIQQDFLREKYVNEF